MNDRVGKILYGMLFCIVLPSLLIAWANTNVIDAALPGGNGLVIAAMGLTLMFAGMANLWTYGGGLPMNAYPPPRFVSQGAYRLVKHPIYVGFCVACAGVSMAYQSATGFYLITPVLALCSYALVEGYEGPNLVKRFGKKVPENGASGFVEKLSAVLPLWCVWLAGYEFLIWLGYDERFFDTVLPFERAWPVVEWMEVPYFLTYPFVLMAPFLIRSRESLREYIDAGWFLVLGTLFLMFILPFYSSPREFQPASWLGELILWERGMDGPAAAFPSFHVVWAFLSARTIQREYPGLSVPTMVFALLIAASCVLTGAHSVVDVLAAVIFFYVGINRQVILQRWNRWCEGLANSWRAWRFGGFRVISHFGYSGAAGVVAALILSQFSTDYFSWLSIVLASLVGGALWGQFVEGSPAMLRPFGFYGGLVGGMIAMLVIWIVHGSSPIYWLGVFAMATPLTQATGRLRCLVQGCCHGGITDGQGIRYFNPHTRVGQIASLQGKNICNTQGYSIGTNVLIALVLFRLQWGGASAAILAGCYFILTGVFRFIEESRRGEPQTRIIGGLRLYQWIALGSVVFGAVLTTVPSETPILFAFNVSWPVLVTGLVAGFAWAFGMSMDFPQSNKRFARLTG